MRALFVLTVAVVVAGNGTAATEEFGLPEGASQPLAVLADPSGSIWVTLDGPWAVGRFDPATKRLDLARIGVPKAGESDSLVALSLGPDGAVWTGSQSFLHRVEPSNLTVRSFALPAATQLPGGVEVLEDGAVWYASLTQDRLFRLDPGTGTVTDFPTPQRFGPLHFDEGPAGLVVSGTYAHTYGRVDPATGQLAAGPGGILDAPVGVVAQGDALWFAEMGGSSVARVSADGGVDRFPTTPSPYYPISGPSGILVALDGAVWFIEHFADRVSRLDPAHRTLHEMEVPSSPGANIQYLAQAPDGSIWFAGWSNHKLGRVVYEPKDPGFTLPERVSVRRGESAMLQASVPGGAVFGSPDANLTARSEGGGIVVDATNAAPGTYNLLVSSKTGPKEWLGRYVTVQVEEAPKGAPGAELPLVLALLAGVAWWGRRR